MNDYLTGRLSEQLANEQTDQLTDDWHAPATGSADRQLTDGLTCPSYWLSWQTSWQMASHAPATGSADRTADRWLDMPSYWPSWQTSWQMTWHAQLLAQLTDGWHGPATGWVAQLIDRSGTKQTAESSADCRDWGTHSTAVDRTV